MIINVHTEFETNWYLVSIVLNHKFYGVVMINADMHNINKKIKEHIVLIPLNPDAVNIEAYSCPVGYIPADCYRDKLLTKYEADMCENQMEIDAINTRR